ncbi:hypothetical protein HYDPIDRAFT_27134 [Hydnomerulius pinastri MD-312]|nr:hypothetical protein HYDPIDRAFT_27134 [Hydnomerulius pinastri MD-312]
MPLLRRKSTSKSIPPKSPAPAKVAPPAPSSSRKLAREHKVKANVKSEIIIQELLKLQVPKKSRLAEDDHEEGPSKKRVKREEISHAQPPPAPDSQTALAANAAQNALHELPIEAPIEAAQPPPPVAEEEQERQPVPNEYDEALYSGTESDMTEVTQPGYDTPVSSRASTPQPAYVYDLERSVKIMQEISAKDQALLVQIAAMREAAAKLRQRARDIREMAKAERGRRERMEAFFMYWQNIEYPWDKKWLWGPKGAPPSEDGEEDGEKEDEGEAMQVDEPAVPIGPPTIPSLPPARILQRRKALAKAPVQPAALPLVPLHAPVLTVASSSAPVPPAPELVPAAPSIPAYSFVPASTSAPVLQLAPEPKPSLTVSQLKVKKEAIILKQEAEARQLRKLEAARWQKEKEAAADAATQYAPLRDLSSEEASSSGSLAADSDTTPSLETQPTTEDSASEETTQVIVTIRKRGVPDPE